MCTSGTTIGRIGSAVGNGEDLWTLTKKALNDFGSVHDIGGIIAATFSNPRRFPSLAVQVADYLGLGHDIPAFDLQMACSAYPYAVYLAGKMAADTQKKVLVVNGDVQSRLVDKNDHATGSIFSDAVCVTEVGANEAKSYWSFYSKYDEALECGALGPIKMDGMKVFSFVATEVSRELKAFIAATPASQSKDLSFAPHQANPYMIRQLAKAIGMESCTLTLPEELKNPGSASIPLAIKLNRSRLVGLKDHELLLAGFGAGYSAAFGLVSLSTAQEVGA